MPNFKTRPLSVDEYEEIISVIKNGSESFRPNEQIATCLVLEANMGIRISDILSLRLKDIVKDGNRYRLDIVEQKTHKKREFPVPFPVYQYIENYCLKNSIPADQKIFKIGERAVQKHLHNVVDYLGWERVSTHSFRKFFGTEIYRNNDHDIVLVQKLLQHASATTTQNYIGVFDQQVEDAINGHINLL